MNKTVLIQLEWKYTPLDFLEEPITISKQGIELSISNGLATANIEPSVFEDDPEISNNLTDIIKNRFYAVQILSHKDFSLEEHSRSDIREDGTKTRFLKAKAEVTSFTGKADSIQKDKDGNIVSDTKQDRLDKQNWCAEIIEKHRSSNDTLDQILKSYQMATEDPDNELIHLYEVRDALKKKFDNEKKAKKKLGLTKNEWGLIGSLANSQPVKQGRHRGTHAGSLRDATPVELEQARKATSNLIEKYFIYLDNSR